MDYVAYELAEYKQKDIDWVVKNCDIIDYIKSSCYKKYNNYIQTKAVKKNSKNSDE